jgi:hypothetical protein
VDVGTGSEGAARHVAGFAVLRILGMGVDPPQQRAHTERTERLGGTQQ